MRTRLVVGFAAAAISVTAIACSSSSNPYASPDEYCSAYAKAICQVSSTCQFDSGTCQTYQEQQCISVQTTSSTRQYNSGNVQACIDALNAAYGNNPTSVSAGTIQSYTQTCAKVFPGTVTQGNSCQSNLDCANSADVCATSPGVQAVCATPTPKQVNDVCADPGDECPVNSYCAAQSGGSPKCVASQTTSQPCSDSEPCDSNNQCVGGLCQLLSNVGQDCTATTSCGSGLFCDLYTDSQEPTPQCVTALSFARGSVDCLGIEGQGTQGTGSSSGSASSSGSSSGAGSSSGTTSSSGGSGDAGSEGGSSSGGDAASE
ncbi:MAG TPA: Dickkopf N-terminal cysteine-rich domain-containing protein [Polyangiaceae bacterium]|jgi:hypothetical protein